MGLSGFCRKFIENYAVIAQPLTNLLRKDVDFQIGEEELKAFENLKSKLISTPVLSIYSPLAETELHCDASSLGFGAILLQRQADNKFHPVMYFSRRTSETESKYHSFMLETLAIVYALERFHIYLHGIKFKVYTDCNSLKHTVSKKDINPQINRWVLAFANYDFEILHREGTKMQHVV